MLPEGEVLRYLGYRNAPPDERILSLIRRVADELEACAAPKSSFRIFDCRVDSQTVTLGDMTVESKNLSGHLRGCHKAALMAVTLGVEADSLIRRCSVRDMEKAAVAQAVCAAMVEEHCDRLECEIVRKPEVSGLYHAARFSPGYGDFDISHQKDVLRMLDCARRMGLTLTDGYMLAPSKSVTAVIGFTHEKNEKNEKNSVRKKCEICGNAQCAYRNCVHREVK